MSKIPQGQAGKVTKTTKAEQARILKVQAQLREIQHKRSFYKPLQAKVYLERAKKNDLLTEIESAKRDINRIDSMGMYIKRKVEFYTVACGALQKDIQYSCSSDSRDHMDEAWLTDANSELMADITSFSVVAKVEYEERSSELSNRKWATKEYYRRTADVETELQKLLSVTHKTKRSVESVKRDRDDLRVFMHEHADRTFQTAGDYDTYLGRHETGQTMRSLEHQMRFVHDLNESRARELCSAYQLWLVRTKKDNSSLYHTVTTAWKWMSKNKLATGCRKVKHVLFGQYVPSTEMALLDQHISAADHMLNLCDVQRNNFGLNLKLQYSELVGLFLQIMKRILETQNDSII